MKILSPQELRDEFQKLNTPDEVEYYAKQRPAKTFSILTVAKNLKKAIKQIEMLSEVDNKL